MDIKQRFPLLSHHMKEAVRSGYSLADISQLLRNNHQEYSNIPSALFLRYVHTVYMELALESSTRVNEAQKTGSSCKMPPRPQVSERSSMHLNALLTRFVRERVTSARERPITAFVTPGRVALDRVVLEEPETITMYADPRVMNTSSSAIRVYSSCHSLQVSSRPEGSLLRISVRFIPSIEGPFKGSIVLLVGNRRTIVPIEAYVTTKQTGVRTGPSPLLQPIRVPCLPIDSNKLPRKSVANINNDDVTLNNHPIYTVLPQLSPEIYNETLPPAYIPDQSPTAIQIPNANSHRPLSSGFSLSVGAITISDSDCEPIVSYQTCKEPSKPCFSPTNIIMIKKRSSVSQKKTPTRFFTHQKELNNSVNIKSMSLSDRYSARRYSLPHQIKLSSKQDGMEDNIYDSTSPMFSAPNSCLSSNSFYNSGSDEFSTVPMLRDVPQLIDSIIDLNINSVSAQNLGADNTAPSPKYNVIANKDVINLIPLQLPQVFPRHVSEHTDCDHSTTWGSLTDGGSSCGDTMLSSQELDYNLTEDEIEHINKVVADWNAFSQFDPDEQIDFTDGGAALTVASVSGWHTSRLNLLTDITYRVI